MIYILLSIVCSTLLYIVFKLFQNYNVHTLQAIVVNYSVCFCIGSILQIDKVASFPFTEQSWFLPSILLGAFFIFIFYLTAITVKQSGLAITSVASKLSLIIPTAFALYFYNEEVTIYKILGIVFAIIAILLLTLNNKKSERNNFKLQYLLLPIFVFLGNGFIDTIANYLQVKYVNADSFHFFLLLLFGTAAVIGWIILFYHWIKSKENIHWKSIGFGILLGVPNYGSMYFLISSLKYSGLESSVFFPINNIGIVILSTLSAIYLFKEKFTTLKVIGILLSLISIFCMIINVI